MKDSATALVLSGAVAKGAFEAGVTRVLADRGIAPERFVGTSAGALNAAVLAAGAAAGDFARAAARLERLWLEQASLWTFLAPELNLGLGLSSTRRVAALVERELEALVGRTNESSAATRRVTLTLVTTSLAGVVDPRSHELTHEDEYVFTQRDLTTERGRRRIAEIAAASAAFPFLFVPPRVPDGRQHVDGGVVNNTPIGYAVDDQARKNTIIVVSAEPNAPRAPATLRGLPLLVHLGEILIDERIGRDLAVAESRNKKRRVLLDALRGKVDDAEAIADRIGLRQLEVVTVRPTVALPGGAFRGFFSKATRADHIDRGKKAAGCAFAAPLPAPRPPRPAGLPGPLRTESMQSSNAFE
jgi:NTE family protein